MHIVILQATILVWVIDQCDALFYDWNALKDFVIKLIEDKSS